jgi:hypothetical protein
MKMLDNYIAGVNVTKSKAVQRMIERPSSTLCSIIRDAYFKDLFEWYFDDQEYVFEEAFRMAMGLAEIFACEDMRL